MRSAGSPRSAIVTGGAGFIGSHLVETLLRRGYAVTVVDNLSTGKRENIPQEAAFFECDIASKRLLSLIESEQPDVLAHLAAQIDVRASVNDPVHDANTNIVAFITMMEAVRRTSPESRVVLTSTAGVYGDARNQPLREETPLDPLSPYAISKVTAERYLSYYARVHGIETAVLRFANVYGPRQDPKGEAGVISIFCSRIRAGLPLTIYGDGKQTRDYVFVTDVAEAIARAAELSHPDGDDSLSPVFNVGTGTSTSVLDLVSKLAAVAGREAHVQFEPLRPGEIIDSSLDASRARKTLGWTSTIALDAGLAITYEAIGTPV